MAVTADADGNYLGRRDGVDVLSNRIDQHVGQECGSSVDGQFFKFRCPATGFDENLFLKTNRQELDQMNIFIAMTFLLFFFNCCCLLLS